VAERDRLIDPIDAEGVGFEPTRSCELLAVFKTAAIGH
jgi:hypothetical protein